MHSARHGVSRLTSSLLAAAGLAACAGCTPVPNFPAPAEIHRMGNETVLAFDTNRDKRPDYWQYQAPDGRIHRLGYADASGRIGEPIDLDAVVPSDCPHFLIVLDGVPFELVDELRRAGHFRLFYPPSRVICCFPSMTDLALADLFHTERCVAYQALYFDRAANRMSSGNSAYLAGENAPWLKRMSYRCSLWWDVKVYLDPQAVFDHEMKGILETFRKTPSGEAFAYSVGSAGLGTRGGRPAILAYLRQVDRLCEQIVFERHGRVKISLTADHGHNLTENRLVTFDKLLSAAGYRLTKSLRGPHDVVAVAYGLVTYAEFYTQEPADVAQCLLESDDVEFACYPSGDQVIVRDRTGVARIRQGTAGFAYDCRDGDPLRLAGVIDLLRQQGKVSATGEIDAAALWSATLEHYYPDPLARVWAAFHGLVRNAPNLIVNLRDGACHGSRFFHFMVRRMTSTHGSLNRMNSTTFVMTMLGELAPALPTRDVLPALERLRSPP